MPTLMVNSSHEKCRTTRPISAICLSRTFIVEDIQAPVLAICAVEDGLQNRVVCGDEVGRRTDSPEKRTDSGDLLE